MYTIIKYISFQITILQLKFELFTSFNMKPEDAIMKYTKPSLNNCTFARKILQKIVVVLDALSLLVQKNIQTKVMEI